MNPNTRELLEKMVQAMKAKLMTLPTPKKGAVGPTVNVNVNIVEQVAKSAAAGGVSIGKHSARVTPSGQRPDGSFFSQQAVKGGFQNTLNPIAAYFERKKYAAFSQFGENGSKAQHYLGLLANLKGDAGAAASGVIHSAAIAGGTLNVIANQAAPAAEFLRQFLLTDTAKQIVGDWFNGVLHTMAQQARNAISEVTGAAAGFSEAKQQAEARLRFGGAKADLSGIPEIQDVARDEARDKSRAEGLVAAKASEETAKGIGSQAGKYTLTLAEMVAREVKNQITRTLRSVKF